MGDGADHETGVIHTGDLFDVVPEMPAESVHACVTDPPYGLAFMGRDWDDFEPREYQEWCEEWAREVKRVLKPGGHLLAFSGNRTHHRLFTGVEDAGFEIRDTLTWHYGSGFPKASDVSKTIDKRADAERELGPERVNPDGGKYSDRNPELNSTDYGDKSVDTHETIPATEQAKEWDGWKTGLKPATEYVVMARKPFDGATVDCVLEHGTGALNIDGTRIETAGERPELDGHRKTGAKNWGDGTISGGSKATGTTTEGRYPANVVFDETEAERLDRKVGELDAGAHTTVQENNDANCYGDQVRDAPGHRTETDSGGPSRYFYTSKASKAERTEDGSIDNSHPTVKPQDLMEWLVKMVTRRDQIVLDPFAGSGTTCRAAKDLSRKFVGVERQPKWADVARARCGLDAEDPSNVRVNDDQTGIADF
jgi:site-specific DNA-methyltransferase (adenine-specific)